MSDPPSTVSQGPGELAAALRVWLEHARDYRGIGYVPVARGSFEVSRTPVGPPPSYDDRSAARVVGAGPASEGSTARDESPRTRAENWPSAVKLAYLRDKNLGDCRRCPLATSRGKIVFGVGDPDAGMMFVGEAPGVDEDRTGEPFVGAAGRRLTAWIEALGLRRDRVYIANVLKCRPPSNRDPRPEEIERCSPFLRAQIRAVSPKVIVALGRHAGRVLIGDDLKMYEMRDRLHEYHDDKSGVRVPVVVTYHPSYVLRREGEQRSSDGERPDNSGARKSENDLVMIDLKRALSLAS